jgi:hypothetical protein
MIGTLPTPKGNPMIKSPNHATGPATVPNFSAPELPPTASDTESVRPDVDGLNLTVNIVATCKDKTPIESTLTWRQLRNDFLVKVLRTGKMTQAEYIAASKEERAEDKDGYGMVPATMKVAAAGRIQANINKVTLIVLDIDDGVGLSEARAILTGYEAVVHTTYSHTSSKPKFRIVLPLKSPVEPDGAKLLFDFFQKMFGGRLDRACTDASRLFYLPACPCDSKDEFIAYHLPGKLLELEDAISDRLAAAFSDRSNSESIAPVSTRQTPETTVGMLEAGRRNTTVASVAGMCFERGDTYEKALTHCRQLNARKFSEPLDDREVERTVASVHKTIRRKAELAETDVDRIVAAMNEKYVWLTAPLCIYRVAEGDVCSKDALRGQYAGTKVMVPIGDTLKMRTQFDAWYSSPNRREHIDLGFFPGDLPVVDNHVNLWKKWGAEPIAGDLAPWVEMLDHVFGAGTPERRWAEQWFACPLQNPGIKLKTAMVLWSIGQGVGKSLLADTVGKLYGKHFKTISSSELHSLYNGWAQDSLFILGEENSGSDRRSDANRIKHLVTGDTQFVNEKYRVAKECRNQMNIVFTSNHPDALHVEDRDRRYFIWSIDAAPKPTDFYERFVNWRGSPSGLPALMHHLRNLDMTGFERHGNAPSTNAKVEMVEFSKTDLERWLTDAVSDESISGRFRKELITIDSLVTLYHCDASGNRSNTTAMAKALRRQGSYASRRVSIGRRRHNIVSLRNHEHWRRQDNLAWVAEYNKPSALLD